MRHSTRREFWTKLKHTKRDTPGQTGLGINPPEADLETLPLDLEIVRKISDKTFRINKITISNLGNPCYLKVSSYPKYSYAKH